MQEETVNLAMFHQSLHQQAQRVTEFITLNFTYSQAATKSNVIPEVFPVSAGREPMTLPKVDVSGAAEASTSLVNNKSVALPTRSPRAPGLAVAHMKSRARERTHAKPTADLCKLGHTMTFTSGGLSSTARGRSGFVGLEPAAGEC